MAMCNSPKPDETIVVGDSMLFYQSRVYAPDEQRWRLIDPKTKQRVDPHGAMPVEAEAVERATQRKAG